MEEFGILILVLFFATNLLDIAKSVQFEELEELPLQTFDEIFVEGWWDNDEAEDLKTPPSTNFGQNVNHQIDRQNTQIGQIETNSTDQFGQIEPTTDQNPPLTESDHSVQSDTKSNDQNPPLTESDQSEQMEPNSTDLKDEQKRIIVDKFHAIKDEFKQKGKYSKKVWTKIEKQISKHLKVSRSQIYKWKKELGLSRKPVTNYSDNEKLKIVKKLMRMKSYNSGKDKKSCKEIDKEIAERFGVNVRKINQWKKEFSLSQRRNPKNEQKNLVKKFDQRKAELKRAGFKNSYQNEINITVAKELGLSFVTIYKWKSELGQTVPNKHSHREQKELMKRYYKIKDQNRKISDEKIAKMLKIETRTLYKWKRQFKRQ